MAFNSQDDFEYERELLALIDDFEKKVRNQSKSIFYDIDQWLDIIDFLLSEEQKNEFLDVAIRRALQLYPDNLELLIRRIYILSLSSPDKAFQNLETLIHHPEKKWTKSERDLLEYQKGKLLVRLGEYERAYNIFERVSILQKNEFVYSQAAFAAFKTNRYASATNFLLLAIKHADTLFEKDCDITAYGAGDYLFLDTVIADSLITTAAIMYKSDKQSFDFVEQSLETFVRKSPLSSNYWEMLSEFYFKAKEYDKADDCLDYCLCLTPDEPALYKKKLMLYSETFDKEKECLFLERLLPKFYQSIEEADNQNDKSNLLNAWKGDLRTYIDYTQALKWNDKCISACYKAIKANDKYPICDGETFYSRGELQIIIAFCLKNKGEYQKAIDLSLNAINPEPEYYGHRIRFAELLYECNEAKEAEDIFQTLYEQCCEASAYTEFANKQDKELSLYFQKHKYIIVASWALMKAKQSFVQEALNMLYDNFPTDKTLFENEIFFMQCATIEIFTLAKGQKQKAIALIEQMVEEEGFSIEAILHKVHSLTKDKEIMQEIIRIKNKFESDDYV
ncbi:MAG: tetratricopeptide repeat protein [Candidatus Onthomorpha sp.]